MFTRRKSQIFAKIEDAELLKKQKVLKLTKLRLKKFT